MRTAQATTPGVMGQVINIQTICVWGAILLNAAGISYILSGNYSHRKAVLANTEIALKNEGRFHELQIRVDNVVWELMQLENKIDKVK